MKAAASVRLANPARRATGSATGLLVSGVLAAGLLAGCGEGCGEPAPAVAGPDDDRPAGPDDPGPPKLVVLVVVDQMPSWSFASDVPLLRGGLARIMASGVYYSRAEFPYAITYTAPGHATLGTGAPPTLTRVLGNTWYRPEKGRQVTVTDDPESPVFRVLPAPEPSPGAPGDGRDDGAGPSPADFTGEFLSGAGLGVEGIAEALRRATDGVGKSVSVAVKPRGAVFALGRRPDLAIWYDDDQPAMTTSRYYSERLPDWLRRLAVERPIAPRLSTVWDPTPTIDFAAITGIADMAEGEGPGYGLDTSFPHDLGASKVAAKALRATPFGDDLVFETALAAIENESLGVDEVPDVIALSMSAHDYAGHVWGQESWERLDVFLRIDQQLGALLDELDRRVGKDRYAVIVTSDHGATRMVEQSRASGRAAHRVALGDVMAEADRAAAAVLGPGTWVVDGSISTLYLAPAFEQLDEATRSRALDVIVATLRDIPGLEYAVRTDRIAGGCDQRLGMDAMACRSVIPGVSGQIFVSLAPQSVMTTIYFTGTSHGSANPEDRTVPIIVMAPGWHPGVVDESVSMLQVAPTVAELLRIPPPEAATAPALRP